MTPASDIFTVLQLHAGDDVAVCIDEVPAGVVLVFDDGPVTTVGRIAAGHKVALRDVAAGSRVRKNGQSIGIASKDIRAGELVHVHNLESARAGGAHH
ncbi:MAG: UxaA family hydrolase [Candidatus Dormibacteria bacterium]